MKNDKKISDERDFHDARFAGDDPRKKVGKFYAVKQHANDFFYRQVLSRCKKKNLLELGCGFGNTSLIWLKGGANLFAIDISPVGIERAIQTVKKENYQADLRVMNAEDLDFDDDFFDIVAGAGILHHLDLDRALAELARVMKPDGEVIFIEPLGHNPFINLYRWLTPKMRTEDEHPLKKSDLMICQRYFQELEATYFSLATLLAAPFHNYRFFNRLYAFLQKVDAVILKLPLVQLSAWTVVVRLKSPQKS